MTRRRNFLKSVGAVSIGAAGLTQFTGTAEAAPDKEHTEYIECESGSTDGVWDVKAFVQDWDSSDDSRSGRLDVRADVDSVAANKKQETVTAEVYEKRCGTRSCYWEKVMEASAQTGDTNGPDDTYDEDYDSRGWNPSGFVEEYRVDWTYECYYDPDHYPNVTTECGQGDHDRNDQYCKDAGSVKFSL